MSLPAEYEGFNGSCPVCGQEYLADKIKELKEALEAWENLFYPIDGMEVSTPDWTFKPEIVKLIKQGRRALNNARN
jgi:hypothetical protein